MSTTEADTSNGAKAPLLRRIVVYAVVLLAVFLIGLVPMWLVARSRASERDAAQRELRLCQMTSSLSSAALDARRGEYERARLAMSSFFTTLGIQVDPKEASDLSADQKERLRPLLNQRDDLITLLARSDPASADRLAEMYMSFRKAMG